MIQEYQLRVLPEQAASEQHIKQYVSREKGLDIRTIHAVRVLRAGTRTQGGRGFPAVVRVKECKKQMTSHDDAE